MTTPTLREIRIPGRPGEAAAMPGDELIALGSGFGVSTDNRTAVLVQPAGGPEVTADILGWRDGQVRFRFPAGLGAPGPKAVRVRTRQGTSAALQVSLEDGPRLSAAPVALLPLALQTRFMDDGQELWVRAIPDTIHIDSHDETLTAEESALGQRYHDAGTDRADAWLDLTTRFGGPRAEWIVRATAAGPGTIRQQPWGRVARTRLLPRRLFAFAYDAAGAVIASQHGQPIPFDLPIGPDPNAPADADPLEDPGVRWMVDFAEALANGMAIRLRLPNPPPTHIARLVVLGIETSLAPEAGATALGDALAAHRYTRGIGFLPEGTPTNLTPAMTSVDSEGPGMPPADALSPPPADSNAAVAASALGLADRTAELFAGTPHAESGALLRQARRDMNAALWPATWGYFLEHMFAPVASPNAIESARQHFIAWVRACGPQPVLRVGEQPYGLLPVMPLADWLPADEDQAIQALAGLLDTTVRPIWRESVSSVPRVTDEPPEPDDGPRVNPLLTVLSMQPTSISVRGRSVLGLTFVDAAWRFIRNRLTEQELLGEAWRAEQAALARAVLEERGHGDWQPFAERTVFASRYFPVDLPLVAGDTNASWLAALRTAGWEALRDDAFPFEERPLLYLLLRHSLLAAYLFTAGEMAPVDPWRGGEAVLYGIDEIDDYLEAQRPPMAWDRLTALAASGTAKGAVLDAQPQGELAEVRQSIDRLAGVPMTDVARAAAETLDLSSHRLDAWITSYAQRRLATLPADAGMHLGAYGFVEDIVRGSDRESAGYVHTPSMAHAAAAAILASGFRAHPEAGGARHPFGIDLSSERVRVALSLLDGVRAGQPLGALLGYRFERRLQERGLARYIDEFRHLSPASVTGTAPASRASEAVATANVTDALQLHRDWLAAGRQLPGDWPDDGGGALQAALGELDDGVDALGDILLTEGVFQLARGNTERAAAALRAAALPDAPPPELEAIYTPHAGVSAIHRLTVLLPGDAATPDTWVAASARPRHRAEPRLDAWAGQVLGDPKRVRYRVRYEDSLTGAVLAEEERRLDQLEPALAPLDVVYAAVASERSQRSELEERIIYHAARSRPIGVPATARVNVIGSRQPELEHKIGLLELMELAQALREVLAGARPLAPDDLSLPEAPGTAAVDLADLDGRTAAAESTLRVADTALGAALASPASESLRAAMLAASDLGVPGAVPLVSTGDAPELLGELQAQASAIHAEVRRRISALEGLPSPDTADTTARVDHALRRLGTVFGEAFRAVPRLTAPPRGDTAQIDVSFGASASLQETEPFAAARWFQRLSRVRPGAQRLGDMLLYADALGGADSLRLEVAQLPAVTGDRWLALPFANGAPPVGRVSVVAHVPLGPVDRSPGLTGLMIEQYTEVLPSPAKTTGLALHYDQPNATPPQAIVLAVPPRPGEDWTLDGLLRVAEETLELAKLRMVDLDVLQQAGHFIPATYLAYNAKGVTVATDFLAGRGAPLG